MRTQHLNVLKQLSIDRSSATTSMRNVQLKIKTFKESLEALDAAHTFWVSKAEFSETDLTNEVFSLQWLEKRWEEADISLDTANDLIHAADDAAKPSIEEQQQQQQQQ